MSLEQLSGTDSALLALETPTSPMQVLGVLVLDPTADEAAYSFERLRATIDERVHLMPPFCRQLRPVPLHLDRPYWEPVLDINIDAHLSRVVAPQPGDWRTLGDLVGEIASTLLPRDRPLWHVTVVEGLADGRVAIVARIHHATLYGATGVEFMAQLLDFDPDGRTVDPPPDVEIPSYSLLDVLSHTAVHQAGLPLRAGTALLRGVQRIAAETIGRLRGAEGSVSLPSFAPSTALNGPLTERRLTAFRRVALDDVKQVKDYYGCTVNDVVLAATAYAMRLHLLKNGFDVTKQPVASCPTSQGGAQVAGADRLGVMSVPLPVDIEDPVEQLRTVQAATVEAKASDPLAGDLLPTLADLIPAMVLVGGGQMYSRLGLARMHPPMASMVVSNMAGPPLQLYLAGARIEAIFPFGPLLMSMGVNLTVLSDQGQLDVGVLTCPDVVGDPWQIADGFVEGVTRLLETSG
ncbi:MAG: wax ester/triacylglycerol synthase family O-acyltransferase [Actinomycetes bacterium]